jgi:hypothetical protein
MTEPAKTTSIARDVLARLLELGADENIDLPKVASDYSDLCRHDRINRLHWSEWNAVTASLSMQELESLLKGLTIAELRFGWCGGSVSSVIWVFREIQRRSQEDADRLFEWVIRRSTNPYAPTGSARGATIPHDMIPVLDEMTEKQRKKWFVSFRESCQKASEQRYKEEVARAKKAKDDAETRKRERIGRKAHKEATDKKMRAERTQVIAEGLPLDAIGRLHLIVEHPGIPLDAFPCDWSRISQDTVAAMNSDDVKALLSRCKEMRKGVWRKLAQTLSGQAADHGE